MSGRGNLPGMTKDRVLICTHSAGFGHRKAAEALIEAFRTISPETGVYIIDPFEFARPYLNKLLIHIYLKILKRAPYIYRMLYEKGERSDRDRHGYSFLWKLIINQAFYQKLDLLVEEIRPTVILCTHPFAAVVMSRWRERKGAVTPAITGLITDYTVHPFWKGLNLEGYFTASPDLLPDITDGGISGEMVWATGIPVSRKFGRVAGKKRVRLDLGLNPYLKTILVMGGGFGLGDLDEVVKCIGSSDLKVQLMVVTGINTGLQKRLKKLIADLGIPVKVFGFVDNIPEFMAAADIIVSKPGGITVAEALAAKLPIIIWKPIPGQEVRNASFLVKKRLGRQVNDGTDLIAAVKQQLDLQQSARLELTALNRLAARNIAGIVIEAFMS